MNENGASNVTQVLKAFQKVLMTYKNPLWVKNASVEDIKSSFKLGKFVETTINSFKTKEILGRFLVLLEIWGKQNNLSTDNEFFTLANDHLLQKLFNFPNVKESTLDIGVRVYTSMYPKERFKECIKKLILVSSSSRAIADFVIDSMSDISVIENKIILSKWNEYCRLNLEEALKAEIGTFLSLYNVEDKLPRIISILALKETQEEKRVQELILHCLLNKMLDRSLLSKSFWLVLFKNVNVCHINQASKNFFKFLESLLNFIEYIGGMMIRDNSSDFCEWISDPHTSFCHEISYFELTMFLKTMCCDLDLKKIVVDRLDQAKEYSNAELWSEIMNDIIE